METDSDSAEQKDHPATLPGREVKKSGARKRLLAACLVFCLLLGLGLTACEKEVPVSGIDLEDTELTLDLEQTATIAYLIIPDNATNKNVTWSSSDPDVALVDHNGLVTPLSWGATVIRVTSQDGNISAECTVTVASTRVVKMCGYADDNGYRIGIELWVYSVQGEYYLDNGAIHFIKTSNSWLSGKSFYAEELNGIEKHATIEDAGELYLSGNIDGEGDYIVHMVLRADNEFFFDITQRGHMAPLYVSVIDFPCDDETFLTILSEGSIEIEIGGP